MTEQISRDVLQLHLISQRITDYVQSDEGQLFPAGWRDMVRRNAFSRKIAREEVVSEIELCDLQILATALEDDTVPDTDEAVCAHRFRKFMQQRADKTFHEGEIWGRKMEYAIVD